MIWEPACGDGWISTVFKHHGYYIVSSDLRNDVGYGAGGIDFLKAKVPIANIVTNPPYSQLEAFIEQGIALARRKFCILVRLATLASARRWKRIYSKLPPTRIHVFSERITMYPYGIITGGKGTTEYAWFVWSKQHHKYGEPHSTRVDWIEPGTRARYN